MFSRRFLLTFGLTFVLAASSPALSAEKAAFTPDALAAAQKAGKPVLVDISAPWCPTCKAQAPILKRLLENEKFKGFVKLDVDFDSQTDIVRSLGANMQSTLIVFKGTQEVSRSVGDTNPESIEALLAKAL